MTPTIESAPDLLTIKEALPFLGLANYEAFRRGRAAGGYADLEYYRAHKKAALKIWKWSIIAHRKKHTHKFEDFQKKKAA